ncbi:MAG: hypothetical protein JOZ51_08320 [Chloroflexi bacterium]|nr:hypothetical protein [Chloroflexota bacterium]
MAQHIIYPALNIYLGTSPIAVGRYVNRELRRLAETDQRKVASLFIDTMPIQEERINGHRTPGSDTMQIIIPRYQRSGLEDGATNGDPEACLQYGNLYITNNGHKAQHKPGISAAGAGGIRNNGHVAFCSWASSIQQRINDKLDLINSPPPDVQDERAAASLRVNIIAFLGGGTGSGVLPALTLLTRYVLMRKNVVPQTTIYAVLPEQPRGATEDMRRRQRSNAYSTLLELTALLRLKNQQERAPFYFGSLKIDVAGLQPFDVLYVYGHGKLTDHTEIYQHIGMDIFTRLQDGHGAGRERMRQLPDLSGLQETDERGLPTCFATSGVTEVIFPRQELLGAFARRASLQVLATQISDLSAEDQIKTERFSNEQAARLADHLTSELGVVQVRLAPEPFDSDIIDAGEEWWTQAETRIAQYRKELRFSRSDIVSALKAEITEQVRAHINTHRSAIFGRYARIYQELYTLLKQRMNSLPGVARAERQHELEERMMFPGRFRRRHPGRFAQYANEMLDAEVAFVSNENQREALSELVDWLSDEAELRAEQFKQFRLMGSSDVNRSDRQLIEEGRVPYPHKYVRAALPSGELVQQLYLYLLRQNGLEKNNDLNVTRVLEELQTEQHTQTLDLSTRLLEEFFLKRFHAALQNKTILEIILQFGDTALLRQHLRWGMEWARGHLYYHPYQETRTNGRIPRQMDVVMLLRGEGDDVRQILNEESNRSEIQDGLKLHDSLDRDRMTFLYTEYAIAVRAMDGMHESNDSYLSDYIHNQINWTRNGSMPTHSSTLLQQEVGLHQPGQNQPALVVRFADEPQQIDVAALYGHAMNGNGHL